MPPIQAQSLLDALRRLVRVSGQIEALRERAEAMGRSPYESTRRSARAFDRAAAAMERHHGCMLAAVRQWLHADGVRLQARDGLDRAGTVGDHRRPVVGAGRR